MNAASGDPVPFLAALADATRLRLIQVLASQPADRALCVGALAARLGVSQPAVSQHLRVLRGLGLVLAERRGPRVHYVLDRSRFRAWWNVVGQSMEQVLDERR